jgi:hypothetical protein
LSPFSDDGAEKDLRNVGLLFRIDAADLPEMILSLLQLYLKRLFFLCFTLYLTKYAEKIIYTSMLRNL